MRISLEGAQSRLPASDKVCPLVSLLSFPSASFGDNSPRVPLGSGRALRGECSLKQQCALQSIQLRFVPTFACEELLE